MSIGTLLFVLAFLVIGLTVVLVAMRGGPRTARAASPLQRRWSDRFTGVGVLVAVALIGLGIPALVIATNADSKSKDAPGGIELSDAQSNGRELFVHNCGVCHTLAAAGTSAKVGPNLDALAPPKALVVNAIEKGRVGGAGQMPANVVTGQDAQDVASFVSAVAGR